MTAYPPFNRYAAIVDADVDWFLNNADRRHRVRPADPFEIESDAGRCPPVPLLHYAVVRLGRYNQLQKILFPQPYPIDLEDLDEDQAKIVFDSYLAHVPLGVRADFSTS